MHLVPARFAILPVLVSTVAFAHPTLGATESPSNEDSIDRESNGWSPPASFLSLPSTTDLPDVWTLSSGRRVSSARDWTARRAELKEILQFYQYGRVPPRLDRVEAVLERERPHASGRGREEWRTLVIGSERRLRMRFVVYVPDSAGPYPAVIREEGTLGRTEQIPMFLAKGYMFIEYARHDLDPDRQGVVGPAQAAYPSYDWATLAVWAWGGMRVVDYLETRDDVDRAKIAITGHSRGGKMALLAGALDERFTLVVPNGSGAGGAGSYRILGPGAESLGMNDKPHWYHERIRWFGGREDRLPFDQHFLKALVAPRALLCTESVDDEFANPAGTQATTLAAHAVFRFLGAEKRNGIHFRRGKHDSNTEDWKALLEFAEWQFFDRTPERPERFWRRPFPTGPSNAGATAAAPGAVSPPTRDDAAEHWIRIGAAGNRADRNYYDAGKFGAVSYEFEIGRNPVTNAQYAEFLNAVAKRDPHELYHPAMATHAEGGIVRRGETGEHRYLVKDGFARKAVVFVSWFDALRYCNWRHNGAPTGPGAARATESGAYSLADGTDVGLRRPDARFFLTSEDEWYKAAYFDASAAEDDGYSLFHRTDEDLEVVRRPLDWASPLGVRGLADRVWEWNEARVGVLFRGVRSGAWFLGNNRQSAGRFFCNPDLELATIGFRIAKPIGSG